MGGLAPHTHSAPPFIYWLPDWEHLSRQSYHDDDDDDDYDDDDEDMDEHGDDHF